MNVYRGFASMNEALDVFLTGTVGGREDVPNWNKDTFNQIAKQKSTEGEGLPRVMRENKREAPFIEYTKCLQIAINFGTLCVIGGVVKDEALIQNVNYSESCDLIEAGIFFKSDVKIDIQEFHLGYFYSNYDLSKYKLLANYRPINQYSLPFNRENEGILSEFLDKVFPYLSQLSPV